MAKFGDTAELIKCAFCGKSQKQVKKLIAGPGVHICDECIELCNEIVDEEFGQAAEVGLEELPIPRDIRAFLDEYVVGQEQAKKVWPLRCSITTAALNTKIRVMLVATKLNCKRATSCCLGQPVVARHTWLRHLPDCSMFHLR